MIKNIFVNYSIKKEIIMCFLLSRVLNLRANLSAELRAFLWIILILTVSNVSFQIYAEANRLLSSQLAGLCETTNPIVQEGSSTLHSFSLQPPSMADIAEVTLSDKSDKEEDC